MKAYAAATGSRTPCVSFRPLRSIYRARYVQRLVAKTCNFAVTLDFA
jgi:hypothetical protein